MQNYVYQLIISFIELNVKRIKNVQRITEINCIYITLLNEAFEELFFQSGLHMTWRYQAFLQFLSGVRADCRQDRI